MKRKLISLILILAVCLSLAVTAFAEENVLLAAWTQVYDEADLLTAQEEAELNEKLASVSALHNAQIVVMTVESTGGSSADRFIEDTYDAMGFGYGENRDGVLLVIVMDSRDYRILSNGFAGEAITESDIDYIGDMIVSDLSDGDYAEAFTIFADECDYYLDGYLNGFPFHFGMNLIISLVIGLIVALIVTAIMKSQLKSVRKQERASVYVKPGSMHLTTSNDLFLYRTVTRTKKPTNNSSGSGSRGGSSRSVGGGKF